jgi:hypothetical protein
MGQYFDHDYPFRLVFAVTKGDNKGDVIRQMVRGAVVAHKTKVSALAELETITDLTVKIPGDFTSYGAAVVIDESKNLVVHAVAIF